MMIYTLKINVVEVQNASFVCEKKSFALKKETCLFISLLQQHC